MGGICTSSSTREDVLSNESEATPGANRHQRRAYEIALKNVSSVIDEYNVNTILPTIRLLLHPLQLARILDPPIINSEV